MPCVTIRWSGQMEGPVSPRLLWLRTFCLICFLEIQSATRICLGKEEIDFRQLQKDVTTLLKTAEKSFRSFETTMGNIVTSSLLP